MRYSPDLFCLARRLLWTELTTALPCAVQFRENVLLRFKTAFFKHRVLRFKKSVLSDEGRQRQAALLAFSAFAELEHVFLVDEDVDCFDIKDVMWAMTTRFQANKDLICIQGVQCHLLDPSNQPEYAAGIRARGVACKAIVDCTVPVRKRAPPAPRSHQSPHHQNKEKVQLRSNACPKPAPCFFAIIACAQWSAPSRGMAGAVCVKRCPG